MVGGGLVVIAVNHLQDKGMMTEALMAAKQTCFFFFFTQVGIEC